MSIVSEEHVTLVKTVGHVYIDASLKSAKVKRRVRMFVDTGSTFTILPYKLAEEVHVHKTPLKEKVSLVDGSVKEYEVALTYLEVLGRETAAKVLLGVIEEPVLGVETLETLGLRVDPVTGKVEPSRGWKARAPLRI